jgi:hypothetical protein
MITIDSYVREKKKDLSVGVYSLYALDPVHEGMHWETATVTLARWEPKGKTGSKLPMRNPVAKFRVLRSELSWQLPLLESVWTFANQGKVNQVLRGMSGFDVIASQKDWDTLKTNCRMLAEGGLINA